MPELTDFRDPARVRALVTVGARLAADPASWNEGEPEVEWLEPIPEPLEFSPDEVCPPSTRRD